LFGLNAVTENAIRKQSEAGVLPFVLSGGTDKARELQAFHLSDPTKDIQRANEDYQAIVMVVTGMASDKAAAAFKRAIDRYDAPLDLLAVSQELVREGISAEDAQKALIAAGKEGTASQTIPRRSWEQQYLQTLEYVNQWSKSQ
jgi:hypothetical protein